MLKSSEGICSFSSFHEMAAPLRERRKQTCLMAGSYSGREGVFRVRVRRQRRCAPGPRDGRARHRQPSRARALPTARGTVDRPRPRGGELHRFDGPADIGLGGTALRGFPSDPDRI
jgi:hypothetical protein